MSAHEAFWYDIDVGKRQKISVSVYAAFCHPAENDVLGLTLVECGCDYIRDTA